MKLCPRMMSLLKFHFSITFSYLLNDHISNQTTSSQSIYKHFHGEAPKTNKKWKKITWNWKIAKTLLLLDNSFQSYRIKLIDIVNNQSKRTVLFCHYTYSSYQLFNFDENHWFYYTWQLLFTSNQCRRSRRPYWWWVEVNGLENELAQNYLWNWA